MSKRTFLRYPCVCLYVFVCLFAHSHEATSTENTEQYAQSSGDIIMKEDAEEMFYNVDIEKYNELGIRCPDLEPPENGFISGEDTRVGTIVYVSCNEGFRLEGPKVLACVPSSTGATWDPAVQRMCVAINTNVGEPYSSKERALQGTELKQLRNTEIKKLSIPPSINPRQRPFLIQRENRYINRDRLSNEEPQAEVEQNKSPLQPSCLQKPDAGPCRAFFKRYYFSKTSMECHPFVFGGCQGNENNFKSVEECNLACLGV